MLETMYFFAAKVLLRIYRSLSKDMFIFEEEDVATILIKRGISCTFEGKRKTFLYILHLGFRNPFKIPPYIFSLCLLHVETW